MNEREFLYFILHRSYFIVSKDSPIRYFVHRAKPHVDVGKSDDKQAEPREPHMPAIERAACIISRAPDGFTRKLVAFSAD